MKKIFLSIPGKSICIFLLLFFLPVYFLQSVIAGGTNKFIANRLDKLTQDNDAVFLADADGKIIYSKNATRLLVPASTLKLLTSLVALHYLGPGNKFITEFYLDNNSNLKIKGYGDPLLISEVLKKFTDRLALILKNKHFKIKDLVLDDTYFKTPIAIDGVSPSFEPFDAPDGALCVNFNTVKFRRSNQEDYISAEPQTPLVPFVLQRIRKSGLDNGRIILSQDNNDGTFYTGHLLLYFLQKKQIPFYGVIRRGKINKKTDKLILKCSSPFPLTSVIFKLLKFSNNFIANQLFIATGAKVYGSPGTLAKGKKAALLYSKNILAINDIHIVEGSGISRKNRISAKSLYKILRAFLPYRSLLNHNKTTSYKTGTLKGIKTKAGYIENLKGKLFYFAVLINTPGKSPDNIMDLLVNIIRTNRKY